MPEKTAPQGITGITISGFKSLREESHIDVRPLTILAGANSSGKSSIMQPLLLMKQTLEMSHDPGTFRLDGENIRFTSVEQFLLPSDGKTYQNFVIGIQVDNTSALTCNYRKVAKNIEVTRMEIRSPRINAELRPGMLERDIFVQLPSFEKPAKDLSKLISENSVAEWKVDRNRCFLSLRLFMGRDDEPRNQIILIDGFPGFELWDKYAGHIKHMIHVPGLRGNPQRNYPVTTALGPEFQATFQYYIAGIINDWKEHRPKRLKLLGNDMERLGLTWKIDAKRLDDTQVELRVGRLPKSKRGGARDMVSIADVGFGVSQVLPVVVALLAAQPGQLVYIEQPEIHLHPRAQVALAAILANAARRGVRVIVETHSALLIQGVQTLVASKQLDPDQVILHWFTRRDDGSTQITSRELDTLGAYGDWPEDFADVQFETDSAYLDIVEQRRAEDMNGYQEPEMSGD
ncbi:MAG: AAA family ATPase [Anaerolineae bacterium]|nr:AAA family ATPase [Anaerolineae bacterium]